MARQGAFHPEVLATAWFDPDLYREGWFDTDLIPEAGAGTTLLVSVFDADAASEFVLVVVNPLLVVAADTVDPSDTAQTRIPMGAVVFDDVPPAEVGTILRNPLLGTAGDDVVPGESVVVAMSSGPLTVVVFDTETVQERRSLLSVGYVEALMRHGAVEQARAINAAVDA